jgi:hypothetical protein
VGDETRDALASSRLRCALVAGEGDAEAEARTTELGEQASARGRPPTAVSTRGPRTRLEKVRNGRADAGRGCSLQEWRLWFGWCLGALVGWPAGPLG